MITNINHLSKPKLKTTCNEEEIFESLGMPFTKLKYQKGEIVIDIGDIVDNFYYLKKGTVRIYLPNELGDLIFYTISSGSSLVEPAFFCGLPSKVRVVADQDSVIISFPKYLVISQFNQQNEFVKLMINIICKKLYLITTMYENIGNKSSERKLAKILYLLSLKNDNTIKTISITHEELALMLGMHRVTVTRNLTKLKRSGLITINRQSIVINDVNRLASYF